MYVRFGPKGTARNDGRRVALFEREDTLPIVLHAQSDHELSKHSADGYHPLFFRIHLPSVH
jgi:hypothetical protein